MKPKSPATQPAIENMPRPRSAACDSARDLAPALERVRPFTMVPTPALIDLARQVQIVLAHNIPGNFVECGVWRGGASFLMADLLRQAGVSDRKVWLCDSFEGIPPPEEIDGAAALEWARDTESSGYQDNLRVSVEEVRESARALRLADHTEFVQGWFDQTLPAARGRIGPIAILRIDCDWYSSVRCCLDNLYDQVVEGGFVIFDDYYTYDGCAVAVHEFLGERRLAHRIESLWGAAEGHEYYQCALFRKGAPTWGETWSWMRRLQQATQEIAALVPPGSSFLLVDENQWDAGDDLAGRHPIPFLEREGEYWGPPEDDAVAIQELERLRQAGASHIVFAWPAFWWLEEYSGLHRHLRERSRCVLENDRLVIFDLRQR